MTTDTNAIPLSNMEALEFVIAKVREDERDKHSLALALIFSLAEEIVRDTNDPAEITRRLNFVKATVETSAWHQAETRERTH